jgi:predicted phage-related endonuclease
MTLQIATGQAYRKHVDRRLFIGGSDARIIMGSDEAALTRLWREKRGEAEQLDYSDNLVVQLGVTTEPLNRLWYERTTGQVIKDVQTWVRHPVIRWMAATACQYRHDKEDTYTHPERISGPYYRLIRVPIKHCSQDALEGGIH